MKKWLNRLFIDGLSGMATGLFSTLIVGTIIQQVGNLIGGNVGNFLFLFGKTAAALTGAGIGCGVACKFKESPLVVLSAATSGMVGAFASSILNGSILMDGAVVLSGPGEPLGAFIAAYVGIELGHLISGKTKLDIILTPILCILAGSVVGLILSPPISAFMNSGRHDQLGNGAAALPDGNHRLRAHGHDSDPSHQLRGPGRRPGALRPGGGSRHSGLLRQHGGLRRGQLQGE